MTKMKILALLICAIPTTTMAQRWNMVKKNSIDLVSGLEMSSILLKPKSALKEDIDKINHTEPRSAINPTYLTGLDYNFALSSTFFIKTGGRFYQTGYTTENKNLIEAKNLDQLNRISASKDIETFTYKFQYLQIPIMGRWVYSGNRCKSFVEFGVTGNMYLNSKIYDSTAETGNSKDFVRVREDITPFHFFGVLSIGGEFWITKTLPAFIQLTGRGQISKLINNGIKEETMGMGIQSGIRYAF